MKIAIIGTRGIPNHYGGFEQATEYLSVGLADKGHEVTVYCSGNNPYKKNEWNGIKLIHCKDPERRLKTLGQFIYDLNCIRNARKKNFDAWIFMGYTSSSIWHRLFPGNKPVFSNMDGLEYKRSKYNFVVRKFLKYAERLAVKNSNYHIADSPAIKSILDNEYRINCHFIPYGACTQGFADESVLSTYNLKPREYFMVMARMEPENHVEMIIQGFLHSTTSKKLIVVGNHNNSYGKNLLKKFKERGIIFTGGLFEQGKISGLRRNAAIYFHGHSVGGTNPSLLEAMCDNCIIAAHRNIFNETVLGENAMYFTSCEEIKTIIEHQVIDFNYDCIKNNLSKIESQYNWALVVESYHHLLLTATEKK